MGTLLIPHSDVVATLLPSSPHVSTRLFPSSSTMSSSGSSRPCVVCGVATLNRCGECAANGTDWMFFCSREHQKLVRLHSLLPQWTQTNNKMLQIWFMHKRVCGKNSSPFRWPGLSEKEIEQHTELGTRKSQLIGAKTTTRWIDDFASTRKLPGDDAMRLEKWRVSWLCCSSSHLRGQ